jgi:hypothetical protein
VKSKKYSFTGPGVSNQKLPPGSGEAGTLTWHGSCGWNTLLKSKNFPLKEPFMNNAKLLYPIFLMAVFALFVSAQSTYNKGKSAHRWNDVWAGINLTAQQKVKVDSLRSQFCMMEKPYLDQIKSLHQNASDELLKNAPNAALLDSSAAQFGTAASAMAQKWIEHMQNVKSVLNPDQFSKLMRSQQRIGEHWMDSCGIRK